jgi:hypothetical protein
MILLGLLLIVFLITVVLLVLAASRKELVSNICYILLNSCQRDSAPIEHWHLHIRGGADSLRHHLAGFFCLWSIPSRNIARWSLLFLVLRLWHRLFLSAGSAGYTLINLSYALPSPALLGSNEWMMIITSVWDLG